MLLRQIFDEKLAQYAYLIGCEATGEALLIDPERDVDRYVDLAEAEGLRITGVAETHVHADFLSGARELAERLEDVHLYLSAEGGQEWRAQWTERPRQGGGSYHVTFLRDGDTFRVGGIELRALHTPGHTPEHLSYLVTDRASGASTAVGIASGDFVFVGDVGRPDLLEKAVGVTGTQEGAARQLFDSLAAFDALEDHVQVWPGHGAGSVCGKAIGAIPTSTVGYERRQNTALIMAREGKGSFVDTVLTDQPEPQTYFLRMKRQNRDGPPVLGDLPRPRRLGPEALAERVRDAEVVILDTRLDRSRFMARHLPGALYAPMNRSFNTVVGSLVLDERKPILLVVNAGRVAEAVRDLIRIGYDRIESFAEPGTLDRHFAGGGESASIDEIDFAEVARSRSAGEGTVVDVRSGGEYRRGHLPGAVHAPYTRLPLLEDRLPEGSTLLVHCRSGTRSAAASAFLAGRGRAVRYVNDDLDAWARAGHPLVEGPPPAPVGATADPAPRPRVEASDR